MITFMTSCTEAANCMDQEMITFMTSCTEAAKCMDQGNNYDNFYDIMYWSSKLYGSRE